MTSLPPTPARRGSRRLDARLGGAALACATLPWCAALAQSAANCERVESRTTLGAFAGERVTQVKVATESPLDSGMASRFGWLHVRTRDAAIRQRLLVVQGEVLDTLRLAESLRRLRRLRFLDDVSVVGERCANVDGVTLTIATHDAWSMAPDIRLVSAPPPGAQEDAMRTRLPNAMLGLEERNFLGTGRELRTSLETRYGRIGGSAQLTDPFVLGRPILGRLRVSHLPNEKALAGTLRSDERYVDGPWRGQLTGSRISRWPMATNAGGGFVRSAYQGLLARRVTGSDASSALFVSGGMEYTDAHLRRFDGVRTPGPEAVTRGFVGVDVGIDRIAASYRPNTTLLPRGGVYDVPQGFEFSAVVGLGRERLIQAPGAHLDSWIGRVWQPTSSSLLSTDVWTSGYLVRRRVSAGSLRAATGIIAPAPRGMWMARLTAERLVAPDPDVRALIGLDPTAMMLEPRARLAGTALAASIERDVRVNVKVARTAVDFAAFGAGSFRRAACGTSEADIRAGAIGVGIRTVPLAAARTAMRLDYVVPVVASAGVRSRPFATLTFAPTFGADRSRDMLKQR